jgi:hypothetical protein
VTARVTKPVGLGQDAGQPFVQLLSITTDDAMEKWIAFAREQGATEEQCVRARELWTADRKASVQVLDGAA